MTIISVEIETIEIEMSAPSYPLPFDLPPLRKPMTGQMISFHLKKILQHFVTFEASMWCGAHVRTCRRGSCVDLEPGVSLAFCFFVLMEEYERKVRMFDELAQNMCFLLGMGSFFHLCLWLMCWRQLPYINLRLTEILLMDTNVAQCVFWLSNLSI